MYVCICKGVTEKQVQQAAENGCRSIREVRLCLGVGSQCGKCVNHACKVLEKSAERCDKQNNFLLKTA